MSVDRTHLILRAWGVLWGRFFLLAHSLFAFSFGELYFPANATSSSSFDTTEQRIVGRNEPLFLGEDDVAVTRKRCRKLCRAAWSSPPPVSHATATAAAVLAPHMTYLDLRPVSFMPSARAATSVLVRLLLLLVAVLGSLGAPEAPGADDACASLDMRVESSDRDTATVSFAAPDSSSKMRTEYSKGKFPTQSEMTVKGGERASYTMTGLDPGKKYSLRLEPLCPSGDADGYTPTCEAFLGKSCRIEVTTQASRGHDCELHEGVDYRGHDMVFGHGGAEAARRLNVGGAEACCNACANVEPSRPYNDICTHFVYEVDTDTCYFKSPDAEGKLGMEEREGYIAGKVVPQ